MDAGARYTLTIIDYAAMKGADRDALLKLSGHTAEALNDDQKTIPRALNDAVMAAAVRQTGDPYFGLHFGEYLQLAASTWVLPLVQSAATVRAALHSVAEFAHIDNTPYDITFTETSDYGQIVFKPYSWWYEGAPESVHPTSDFLMAFGLKAFQSLAEKPYFPILAQLMQPEPPNRAEYERIFNCPLEFSQPAYAFRFKKIHLDQKAIFSNAQMHQYMLGFAMQKLGELKKQQGFSLTIKKAIMNLVRPQFPTIEQVAANLGLSVRSIQRRLKEEALTYKGIIDDLRKEYALNYLKDPDLSVKEIAYMLDYGDMSAFVRAFKRWTGKSPTAWRKG